MPRFKLQPKLTLAFLIIGVGPMVLSTFIAVKIISTKIEKEVEKKIEKAAQLTLKEIEHRQKKAGLVSEILVHDPQFIKVFKRRDPKVMSAYLNQLKRKINIDVIMVTEDAVPARPVPAGDTLMLIEGEGLKTLLAGTVTPLQEGDKVIGTIYTGDILGENFAKEMEKITGIDTVIYLKNLPEKEEREEEIKWIRGLSPTPEIREEVFKKGKPFYASKTKFNDTAYHGLYQPLLSSQEAVLGMIFFGIPYQYSFQSAVSTQRFFPIIIGLGVGLALLLGYFTARGIINPLNSFVKVAKAISSGDLDQKVEVCSRDEIGELSSAFNLMTKRLREFKQLEEGLRRKERLAALGELSAGVAHEIRNPLSVIKNSAEIIRKKQNGTEVAELTTFIIDEVDRLNRVVENLLDFAKPKPPLFKEEAMAEIMDRSVRIIEEKAGVKGISIIKEYNPHLPPITCDSEQIEQAFLNILLNAVEAIEGPQGKIIIRLFMGKDFPGEPSIINYLYIQVKDNGPGLKAEDSHKIFNPFFTTKARGTGLGLSIVHKIIENHEGEINLGSRPGEGTTVTIKMPLKARMI